MATLPWWKEKAARTAKSQGHHLGRFMQHPFSEYAKAGVPARALAVCRSCEATVLVSVNILPTPTITGTAIDHRCPYRYSTSELAAIDRAHPVHPVDPDDTTPVRSKGDAA